MVVNSHVHRSGDAESGNELRARGVGRTAQLFVAWINNERVVVTGAVRQGDG